MPDVRYVSGEVTREATIIFAARARSALCCAAIRARAQARARASRQGGALLRAGSAYGGGVICASSRVRGA